MNALALARHLLVFDSADAESFVSPPRHETISLREVEKPQLVSGEQLRQVAAQLRAMDAKPAPPPVDVEAERRSAFSEGLAQGRDEATAEWQTRLLEAEEASAARFEAAKTDWTNNFARDLAQQLRVGLREIENEIAEALAEVVKPFVAEGLMERIVACFRERFLETLAQGEKAVFLEAPKQFCDEFATQALVGGAFLDVRPSADGVIRVRFDKGQLHAHLNGIAALLSDAGASQQ